MKLSVLVPSVLERMHTFLPKCLDALEAQRQALPAQDKGRIEILCLIDGKSMALGDKRNCMVEAAKGEYVVHVDDDDRLEPDYLSSLLEAADMGPDVITFHVSVSINGGRPKICRYSKDFPRDRNHSTGYDRLPNHICAVKREIAIKVPFPSIKYGEDFAYAALLRPHLKTQVEIPRVLYHYDYNEMSTVAQEDVPHVVRKRRENLPISAEVVMLSDARTEELRAMTQRAVDSIIKGANGLRVKVHVVERQPGVSYDSAELIHHNAEFNYSAFNNLGASVCEADWLVFANNDIVADNGWLHVLLGAGHPVVSPKEPTDVRQKGIKTVEKGFVNGRHFSPWFFMVDRNLFNSIGGWDEEFRGWFADDALIAKFKAAGVAPMIVPRATVRHLGSVTQSAVLSEQERSDFAWDRLERYNEKYGDSKFVDNPNYLRWKGGRV